MKTKISIALIDDDPYLTNLLSKVLAADDFEVSMTNDSSQYREFIKNASPDVILLDWMMPKKDGIEILAELKSDDKTKNIPVFMLTTKNMLNEVNRLFTAGADDYICKPFNVQTIAKKIKDKLENYHNRNNS